ncbi:MAG: tRNA 2-thiouridine(34) synthase MnmA [Defluviitaleaceae bacterium]|nr:tRNA 2-thiouridine(34) synthase MnmA [Defluviitaleaceae bacterium]
MRILTAMSGGVDSSVAAYLLAEQGHEIIGAMMKLFDGEEGARSCCTLSDAEDARAVANAIGIPFYVFNYKEAFAAEVMARFVKMYLNGLTPNPCIDCNRFVKFEKFLHRAKELECDAIATGHYARISKEGRFLLKKGLDSTKDQSYVLYAMKQEQLAKTVFPLGELTKDEVRAIAQARSLINAKKRDSQDICFVPSGDYAGFITGYTGRAPQEGNFVNKDGEILGKHRGIINYTIGQRKGLGISAPQPLFVTAIKENTVVLGASDELFSKEVRANDINLIPFDKLDGKMRVQAKIRYAHTSEPATLWQTGGDELYLEFDSPQRAITAGQAVVCYDGEVVVGGGTIVN